jgi:hypothetical protein
VSRGARGMALPLVLVALVVIAALVAGGSALAHLEQRIGRNALFGVQATAAAEGGAAAVLADWQAHGLPLLAAGDSAALPPVALPGRSSYAPTVTRLNGELFLVRVEAFRTDAGGGVLARREVGVLVRTADSAVPGWPPVWPLEGRGWLPLSH